MEVLFMKKILSILLCLVMLLSLLAGCGGGDDKTDPTETTKHKHTYATEWSSDENNHWYQATCEHSTLQANLGEHLDENLDGACDICGYEDQSCQHTYSEEWTSDATHHWHAATCNHMGTVSEKAEHADGDNDGACDTCGYMGDHTHTYEETWTFDATQHWHVSSCGHDVEEGREDHVDATNDGVCDTCGWFDESHTHTFSDEWKTDVTYHWHAATCEHLGAVSGQEQHADGDENGYCDTCEYLMCTHQDFDLDGECDTCGWADPEHSHEFGTETGSDVDGHWYLAICDHPGATSEKEPHVDVNNDGVCDICAFQICGHSYAATWTTNETHHWHAILCTCSIERKDYAEHVDADGDGGCDVCMYGMPVEAVYEVLIDNTSITLVLDKMITYTPFTVNFPQPGKYIITPNRGDLDIRVWMTDGSDYGNDTAFYNPGGPLTIEVEEAGEMTFWFRMFSWTYGPEESYNLTYSVVRADDLVMETMQGKVELPANTIYVAKFIAKELGTYKLITSVDGLVIGLTEDSMEYYKGHIELNVTEVGQEFTLYMLYEDESVNSFIFDWQLVEPFCLSVGEGNFAVDVGPTQVDYKIEFTAPTDGYFLLQVHNKWLTFAQMGEIYDTPVRLETMEVLTHYMTAGEVYTIWLQTVYNYPEATNVYDTLTVTNVGEKLSEGFVGAEVLHKYLDLRLDMHTIEFTVPETTNYRITVLNSLWYELTVDGDTSTIYDEVTEMTLDASKRYKIKCYGNDVAQVIIEPVDHSLAGGVVQPGTEGSRYCFQATESSYYRIEVTGGELGIMASNGNITWTTNAYEVELTQGQTYSFLLRGDADVTVKAFPVDYTLDLTNGDNFVTMEPNRYYGVNFLYTYENDKGETLTEEMSQNSSIALTWEGNLTVLVNGEAYKQGGTIALLNTEVKILVKSNGAADVKITVTILDDANIRDQVEGSSNAELILHQTTLVAVNLDGQGAYAFYTAEVGGTYTLTSMSDLAVIYIEHADGSRTQVLVGEGSYSFSLNVGESIKFYVQTRDESMATVELQLTPGN